MHVFHYWPVDDLGRPIGGVLTAAAKARKGRHKFGIDRYDDEVVRRARALYDGEIAFVDEQIGRLLERLDDRGGGRRDGHRADRRPRREPRRARLLVRPRRVPVRREPPGAAPVPRPRLGVDGGSIPGRGARRRPDPARTVRAPGGVRTERALPGASPVGRDDPRPRRPGGSGRAADVAAQPAFRRSRQEAGRPGRAAARLLPGRRRTRSSTIRSGETTRRSSSSGPPPSPKEETDHAGDPRAADALRNATKILRMIVSKDRGLPLPDMTDEERRLLAEQGYVQ